MKNVFVFLFLQLIYLTSSEALVVPRYDPNTNKFTIYEDTTFKIESLISKVELESKSKCEIKTKHGEPTLGFFYDCGEMSFIAFRNRKHCETWIEYAKGESKLNYLNFIPKDVENKAGYDVGFCSCVDKASQKKISIEAVYNYCECVTKKIATKSEVELEIMTKKNLINSFMGKNAVSCMHIIHPQHKNSSELIKSLEEKSANYTKDMNKGSFIMLDGASPSQVKCEVEFGNNGSPKEIKRKCAKLTKELKDP